MVVKNVPTAFALGSKHFAIPAWVVDYDSFRRWTHSEEFPDRGKICFINGGIWVDLSMEDFSSHNAVKAEISRVLGNLMKETKFGRYVPDGMRYGHPETELSTEPDGMVFSFEAMNEGRVQLVGGESGMQSELTGAPEIVIEIISESSEAADSEWAMSAYFDAGVQEYWLIDARHHNAIQFAIYRRGRRGFTAARRSAGWVNSAVLDRAFRLTQSEGADGNPEYTFEVR